MNSHSHKTIAVLNYLMAVGGATLRGLQARFPEIADVRRIITNLQSHGHVVRESRNDQNLGALYCGTPSGKRLLARLDESAPEGGDVAQPRTTISDAVYVPRQIHTRPGSEDFLKCPSRRGDERVAHRPPISLAGA